MTNHKLSQDTQKKNILNNSQIDTKISTPKVQDVSDGNKKEQSNHGQASSDQIEKPNVNLDQPSQIKNEFK